MGKAATTHTYTDAGTYTATVTSGGETANAQVVIVKEKLATPANIVPDGTPAATTFKVKWDAVPNADTYQVTSTPALTVSAQTATGATFTGATAATKYTIGVVAQASEYIDSDKGTGDVTTAETKLATPGNVTASGTPTATGFVATWDAVTDATSYVVTSSPSTTNGPVVDNTARTATWTDAAASTDYTVSVVAKATGFADSDAGTGDVTTAAPPKLATPANIKASGTPTATDFVATWDAVPNAVTYTVTSDKGLAAPTVDNTARTATFTGATTATTYTISAVAKAPNYTDSDAGTGTVVTA